MNRQSTTYRILRVFGIYLSPETYGSKGLFYLLGRALRLWKNEILHKIARNWVMFAPFSSRLIRPILHKWRGVDMGKNVFIGLEVMFDSVYPEKIHIGDGCIITNRVQFLCHNRQMKGYKPGMKLKDHGYVVKDIWLENDVTVGTQSLILPGVRIGKGAVIAAGSIVNKDVPSYTLVAGIPAKQIKNFNE